MDTGSFDVKHEHFDHPSWLHGVNHTCRVMSLVWVIGSELQWERERDLAFCAAYIHDLSRQGDGICRLHGPDAAEKKLPLFGPFFISQGIAPEDLPVIETAIRNHSLPEELEKNHPHYNVTALLKDADALDRFRLGIFNLDRNYLRLPLSHELIPYARRLFMKTASKKNLTFTEALDILQKLWKKSKSAGPRG